jgi:hypothetical protein
VKKKKKGRRWSYKDFCPPEMVEGYVYCNRVSMVLADASRDVAAHLVHGTIGDGERSDKQFLRTPKGLWRMANGDNADNTSETVTHIRMGVTGVVFMGWWDESMQPWLLMHGVDIPYETWRNAVDREVQRRR